MLTFRRRVRKQEKVPAAATEQKTDPPKRYIPPEILEEILLNLPIKSLLRFSCASTSWNSIISTSPQLKAKKGRKMVILNEDPYFDFRDSFCGPLSAISDRNAASSMLVCPFRAVVKLKAFCDELCCVQVKNFLYLWNPSTGARKKLPVSAPLRFDNREMCPHELAYGLGYDAVADDYKLLKILRPDYVSKKKYSFMYSLRNNSWREIKNFPYDFSTSNGLFVNGSLHWIVQGDYILMLVSFEFSTESYRVFKQPKYLPMPDLRYDVVDVAVLRSKLCVFVNYHNWRYFEDTAFALWAMEDYGVVESWTKLYQIRYKDISPIVFRIETFKLRPVYLYEDGRIVIWASCCHTTDLIVYKNDMQVVAHSKISRSNAIALSGTKTVPTKAECNCTFRNQDPRVCGGFVYVESLALGIN